MRKLLQAIAGWFKSDGIDREALAEMRANDAWDIEYLVAAEDVTHQRIGDFPDHSSEWTIPPRAGVSPLVLFGGVVTAGAGIVGALVYGAPYFYAWIGVPR